MSGTGTKPAPPSEDPYAQQQSYGFNGSVLLTAIVLLFALAVVFVLVRLVLYHLFTRPGGGGLAGGILRSINSFGTSSGRRGLDSSALSALPVTAYRKEGAGSGSAAGAASDCAVCLSELADGEKVRELPNCGHVFHVECVDAWLRSRTTCPLCRAEATPPPPSSATAAGATLIVTVQGGFPDAHRAAVCASTSG